MTLLHLITRLSLGGSARNTTDSAHSAVKAGFRTLLATGPSGSEIDVAHRAREIGCELITLPSLVRNISPLRDLQALYQIIGLLRRENVQILHTHTSKAGFIGRLAARLAGVPIVIHTPHGHIFYGYYGRHLTNLFITLERLAAPLTDRIVTLTDREAEEHLEQGIGRPDQYVTIPSGVDIDNLRAEAPSREKARREIGMPPNAPIILGLGRLVPIKGFDLLVRAFPMIARERQDARLILVGDGPERTRVEELAASLGVREHTTFMGAHEGVDIYLAAADILVTPSRNEGMGRSLVEAMALGLPTVATSVGGIPNVIQDGVSGLLVPTEQPRAISEAVLRLLADDTLHSKISLAARKKAEQFSLPVMEERLSSLYLETLGDKNLQFRFEPTAN